MLVFPSDIDWHPKLKSELEAEYFTEINKKFVASTLEKNTLYPEPEDIFTAYRLCSFSDTKVVILGQDPYHQEGQAMGLAFGVPSEVKIPPSLRNVYKEIERDLGIKAPIDGDLSVWARQGVLLLNTSLTVQKGIPHSHAKWGWQKFTDKTIKILSQQKSHIVFMLWGKPARSKKSLIDADKHLILEAAHPSPLARNAFSGCKHFSTCNNYLKLNDLSPIQW